MRHRSLVALSALVLLASLAPPGARAERLDNAGVIALSLGGLSDQTVLLAIRNAEPPAFDTSVRGLLELRDAGLSEEIIRAVIIAGSREEPAPRRKPVPAPKPAPAPTPARVPAPRPAPSPAPGTNGVAEPAEASAYPTLGAFAKRPPDDGFPPEPGIYVEEKTAAGPRWRRMRRAAVMGRNTDSAGAMLSGGLAKTKFKTVVRGKAASLRLRARQPRFFYRLATEAEHPGELCLQRLRERGDRRQYVGMKMSGMTGSMQSCPGESFDFTIDEVSRSGFVLVPAKALKAGEYALAGPSGQRIFDFGIDNPR